MNSEEIIEQSQYNITKILQKQYEQGNYSKIDFLDGINFFEKSSLSIRYYSKEYGSVNYEISESLAVNCIRFLPLQAYENYIDHTWINGNLYDEDNTGVIYTALSSKKYDFIHKMIDIASTYKDTLPLQFKERNDQQEIFWKKYDRSLLKPLINIDYNMSVLSHSHQLEHYQSYYSIFKKILPYFNISRNLEYQIYNKPGSKKDNNYPIVTENNWFHHFKLLSDGYRDKKDFFLDNLTKNPLAFDIFVDVDSQCGTENNPLRCLRKFELALLYGNEKVVLYLEPFIELQEKKIAIDNILQDWVHQKEQNAGRNKHHQLIYEYHILDSLPLYHKLDHTMPVDISLLSYILIDIDKDETKKILHLHPSIKTEKVAFNLTLHEWIHTKKLFYDFISINQLKLITSPIKNELPSFNFAFIVMDNITKHVETIIQKKDITPLIKTDIKNIELFIVNHLLSNVQDNKFTVADKFVNYINIIENSQQLEYDLPEKIASSSKRKNKI